MHGAAKPISGLLKQVNFLSFHKTKNWQFRLILMEFYQWYRFLKDRD